MQVFKTVRNSALVCLALLAGLTANLRAAEPVAVRAELSRPEIAIGEMAELQISVKGGEGAKVPQEIAVEGLQIRLTGQSTQVQMVNFKVSSSAIYSYVVIPQRAGKFTIPSISLSTTSGSAQTAPLSLSVVDSSGGALQSPASLSQPGMPGFAQRSRVVTQRSAQPSEGRLAFGEISIPKKKIYAGEMVPVEIRYYFNAQYQVQILGKADLVCEGLIVERFPDPKESREDRDGVTYNVLNFHTLLSAVKPGVLDVPSAKLMTQIQVPGSVPPGFDDPVFQQLLGGRNPYAQARELTVNTAPFRLEVMPLPKEGRPASFAGAVGQFDMDALVANPKPAPGDPAVLTVKIGGKGNFNAMGSPVLTESDGWRTYPPADKFESSGELTYSGVKSFDFTLIAQEQKTNSPGSEFSYFDPVAEKYVTLTTKPLPLKASPASAATPPVNVATPQATPAPTPAAKPISSAPVTAGEAGAIQTLTIHSWKTPLQRAEFLIASMAMLVAAGALAGILQFSRHQKLQGSVSSRRRRQAELLASLNTETLDAAASYDAAVEYLELLAVPHNEETLTLLKARRDALKYGVGGSVMLAGEERARLLETLHQSFSLKS